MTLAPLVNPSVRGVKGKPGVLGFWCQAPDCTNPAQQRHHIWSRSFLRGQPNEWVTVNGLLLQNTCGLCIHHHMEVTEHVVHIRFNEGLQVLEWWERSDEEWTCLGILKGEEEPFLHQTEAGVERVKEGLCPTCGKPDRKEKPAGPPRNTKTWNVQVPVDEREHGGDVLDEYVDDLSVALGFSGESKKGVRRYHVLVNVLAWVTQMKTEFLSDWEEAGKA